MGELDFSQIESLLGDRARVEPHDFYPNSVCVTAEHPVREVIGWLGRLVSYSEVMASVYGLPEPPAKDARWNVLAVAQYPGANGGSASYIDMRQIADQQRAD